MTSRSDESWRRSTDPELLAFRRQDVDREFWQYVDSQPYGGHGAKADWMVEREAGCLAARTDLQRCMEPTLGGVPFCAFHFDKAWARIEAFVAKERLAYVEQCAELDRRMVNIEVAMVVDAQRVLARQPERVYFYACGDFVKIGRSINPEQRVRTLGGTKAPEGIDVATGDLLGTIPGGSATETALHYRFAAHRTVGEWFELEPIRSKLETLIAAASEAGAA